ncbi:hypothetical protein Uis4E_0096 [Bifidobacterium parmae]|uniref:Uncharacterized protein n=2 Tax=Bifidobacterium parmae TaxID=361854 RepID=A0A2N5J6A9_9BIFI|nr:hypothetical protein Uis4E_0096 [Bifidobacterium parmae]
MARSYGKLQRIISAILTMTIFSAITGCASDDQGFTENGSNSQSQSQTQTVTVRRGKVIPLISATSEVRVSSDFTVSASRPGMFHGSVTDGQLVQTGDKLGTIDDTTVTAPVDGVVTSVARDNSVSANYPLVGIQYGGLSTVVDASVLLRSIGTDTEITGRFQVMDGQGPTNCAAVVGSDAVNTTDTSGISGPTEGTRNLQCLFPKNTAAFPGQSATTALMGVAVDDALLLPISSVSGRLESGKVSVVKNGKSKVVAVKLGVSDGSHIQILKGLNEGDIVSAVAPGLADDVNENQ